MVSWWFLAVFFFFFFGFDFCDWFFLFKTDCIWTNSSIIHGDDLLVTASSGKGMFS
jgi:hypothetical protein